MRTVFSCLSIVVLLFCSTSAQAHSYFFAFAEMEYNFSAHHYELTIEGSAHDVEDALNASGITITELENHYQDSTMRKQLEQFVLKGFAVQSANSTVSFSLQAYEVQPNGMVLFYFKSPLIAWNSDLTIRFDWLMDLYNEQQNKLTFKFQNQLSTIAFLPSKRTSNLHF